MTFRLVAETSFVRNILKLLTGTVLAQLIPLLLSPVMARLYSPEQFSSYALYVSIISPLAVIAAGRYELAIMLPKSDEEASSLGWVSIVFSSLFCMLLLLGCIVYYFFFLGNSYFQTSNLPFVWFLFIPASVYIITLYQVFFYWLNRKKEFKRAGINKVVQSGVVSVSGLSLFKLRFLPGLMLGDFIGRAFAVVYSYFQVRKCGFRLQFKGSRSFQMGLLKKYKSFPLINGIPAFLDSLSLNIPVYIITSYYTGFESGSVNFCRQMIGLPMLMISATIAQVLFQSLTEKIHNNQLLYPEIKKILKPLVAIALVYVLFFNLVGESFFKLIFGEKWIEAGKFAGILAISFGIKFIVSPILISFPVLHSLKSDSIWKVIYFLSMGSLIAFSNLDMESFIFLFVGVEAVIYFLGLAMVVYEVKKYDNRV